MEYKKYYQIITLPEESNSSSLKQREHLSMEHLPEPPKLIFMNYHN